MGRPCPGPLRGPKRGETFNTNNPAWISRDKGVSQMGKLVEKFKKNPWQYLRRKHQCSPKNERERINRVLRFLEFCERMGCEDLKNIKPIHYQRYVEEILSKKSTETKRKHLLTLREFFKRAHIPIIVNPNRNIRRTKEQKLIKLLQILDLDKETLTEKKLKQILKLL
jgi:site-specific recombinase XerD